MKKNNLMKNFGLKILALIFAFGLWLVVVNISDPVATTTISGVPVEILNGDVITKQGKIYEVLEGTDTITVSVSAKRTILDSLSRENIRATADLDNLNEDGMVRIRVESNRYNETIDSIKSKTEYLKVNIEDMARTQFVITPDITGKPVEGYVVGNIALDENVVRVSGPESVVSQIDKAVAEVSVSNMNSSIRTSVELKLYDKEDVLIENRNITKNITNVNISVEVLETKRVPVKLSLSGKPAGEYGFTGVLTSDPESFLIAGSPSVLARVSEIVIPETAINVEGAQGEQNIAVNAGEYLPDGIRFADEEETGKMVVTVGIAPKETKTVEIAKGAVSITGMPDGYEASFVSGNDKILADIMAMPEQLEEFDASDLTAVIDFKSYMEEQEITTLKAATYVVPVLLELPEGIDLKNPVHVTIKISEKKD